MKTLISIRVWTVVAAAALFAGRAAAAAPGEELAAAANNFLAALKPEQRKQATFEFKNDERLNWHFIPKERKGLPLKEMTSAQRHLAYALLGASLSQRGYVKATSIMSLEQILAEIEGPNRKMARDPELYFVTVFGDPGSKGTWGWRWEGHHLAFNFTVVNGEVVGSPNFFGTNPAEVREGSRKGLRVLAAEEDLARQLVKSLDAAQRGSAVFTNVAPRDIITGADRKAKALAPMGVPASKLTKEQTATLQTLVREYVYRIRPDLAARDLDKIAKAGWDKVHFAWAGPLDRGQGDYYRVQGPTFLLEYDNTQNSNNHVHSVWRDLDGDFGEDLLTKHYEQEHLKK
jgi:ABC-type transporter MlaC component